jgi:hypothetical protein
MVAAPGARFCSPCLVRQPVKHDRAVFRLLEKDMAGFFMTDARDRCKTPRCYRRPNLSPKQTMQ